MIQRNHNFNILRSTRATKAHTKYALNCAFIALAFSCATAGAIAQETEPELKPVTTKNVEISVDELKLLVKPMTVEELEVEAEAWFKLLHAKAREIAAANVAVLRTNQAMDLAEEKGGEVAAEAVRDAAEVVKQAADQADQDQAEVGAEVKHDDDQANGPAEDTNEDVPQASEDPEEDESIETAQAAADVADRAETVAASEEAEVIQEVVGEAKLELLDTATQRRAEQTQLVDRLNVVLDSLARKGGDVEAYKSYISAVSLIEVNAKDTTAAWATIKGWALSNEGGKRWMWNILQFAAVFLATWLTGRIIGFISRQILAHSGNSMTQLAKDALVRAIKSGVWVVGFVIAISMLEIDITPMIAAIGAAGLVIGLALQGTLSNVASGVMILINRPFDVDDIVTAGGVTGHIAEMSLVATIFRTFDNQTVIVPNNEIWGHVITNITANPTRRVDLVFGVGYSDDLEKAERIIWEVVTSHELILDDPEPVVKVHELGDSSVNFVCRPWAKVEDYWAVYWDVVRGVKERFDQEGISIPFPQRDVHVHYVNASESDKVTGSETAAIESLEKAADTSLYDPPPSKNDDWD